MKTVREWLEELPDGIRENALDQTIPHISENELESLSRSIYSFCSWPNTREGSMFWIQVSDFLYEEAIERLKALNPEVYEKYYKQYI